ncbi:MAG: malectin domain-containing carbohydrate-binding protein [Bryobacteraceae bacterium]
MLRASLGFVIGGLCASLALAQDLTVQSFPLNNYKRVLDGQWEGIRYASDGNVYFGSSTHSAHHGASFFKYDPRTGQVTQIAGDITTICGEDPQTNPQGKLHSDMVEANGWLYMSTHFAVDDKPGAFSSWTGAHVLGYQLSTGQFRDYGVIHPNATSYSGIAVDPSRNYLYVFVTGGSQAYVYRVDTVTGAKLNLGAVGGGGEGSFYFFIDQRGDVWFSVSRGNGELRRIRGATGQMDVYPNVLPVLTRWDVDQPDPSALNQQQRWIFWMQKLDGDRAVFTMGYEGGTIYLFDSTKTIGSGQEFTALRHLGYTYLGMAVGSNRVYYYQRANRAWGHQEFTDFHLMSVSLDPATGYAITDHGLIKDQNGRLVWRTPGMMTDGNSKVFFVGDWWTIAGDLGTLRYQYLNGVESYVQLPRGEFFAVADLAPGSALSVRSSPVPGVQITGTHPGTTNYSATPAAAANVSLTAPASAIVGGATYSFVRWRLNGAGQSSGATLGFTFGATSTVEAVYVPASVSVSPGSASLGQSQTQQFTANTPVTWSISPAVGAISATGLYTAPASIAAQQSVTVTATSTADASKTAAATVTLNPPPITVTVSPASAALGQGQTQQFTANVSVTWSISPAVGAISAAGLYTAPASIAAQQTVTVTATSTADTSKTAAATVTLTPPLAGGSIVRINCGGAGAPYTDTAGNVWSIDRYYTGGANGYAGFVSGTANPWLYQTARFGGYSNFSYAIPVIPGSYRVNLKFAELYKTAVGQRVFHVDLNGTRVLTSFDVVREVGAGTALDRSFTTVAAGGFVNLVFTGVVDSGTVSAIEVVPDTGSPVSVAVTPASAALGQGQTQQFGANVAVTWSLSPNVGSITTSGLYTAPATIASQQTVTVTATSTADPTKSASATVTLTPPAINVTVSPSSAALGQGQTQQFGANVAVTWSLSPNVGSITTSGFFTAPASIASQQTVTVTATSTADPTKSASATVTLTPPAINVTVSPSSAALGQGQTQQFGANVAVTWSLSPNVGSITTSGLYTAPATIASQQTVTVTATSTADPTKSATATVTLTPPAITVTVSPASAALGQGQTQQFTANVAVMWSLSPNVGSITTSGLFTAPASIASQQTVTVTATSTADPTKSASATVTLTPPAISVTVSPASALLGQGQAQQFGANVAVTWSLSPNLGAITAGGLYTAPATIASQQTVTVTATSTADPTKSASATVTLTPPLAGGSIVRINCGGSATPYTDTAGNVWSIDRYYSGGANGYAGFVAGTANPWLYQTARMGAYSNLSYSIPVTPGNYRVNLKFAELYKTAIGQRVFHLDLNGTRVLTSFDILREVAVGTALDKTFTTTAPGGFVNLLFTGVVDQGIVSAVEILPDSGSAVSVSVSPGSAALGQGQVQQFSANVPVTWTLSPSIGSITAAGLYTAPTTITSQQSVTVTATSTGDPTKTATATVTLTPPAITVTVSPASAVLGQSQTQQFGANVPVTWSLSPSIGSITAAGLYAAPATITSQQSVTVTATSTGDPTKTATATVTLTPPAITVTVSPASAVLGQSQTQQFGSNVPVTWSLIPSIGNITAAGLYTAPATITSQQSVTVTATSTGDPTKTATATVTLMPPAITVTVSPASAVLGQSQTQQFGANVPVTWSLSPSIGSITAAGLYTAPASIATQQAVTVTATSTQDPTKFASANVTLTPPPPLSIAPTTATLGPSQTQQFTANQAVTWSLNPNVGTISTTGLYTAPSSIAATQSVTVTATATADSTRTASASVTLSALAPGTSVVRINCGGGADPYTDPSGQVWLTDRYFSGASANGYAGYVAGTNTPWLYQTARMGTYASFNYSIPVAPGAYQLTLKFAELYARAQGQRVFHVTVNGTRVLSNFDILTVVPAGTATDKVFAVAAPAGRVDIVIEGVAGQGIVSAIEIKPAP